MPSQTPPLTGGPVIEAVGLTKTYGELAAVDGIDFTVSRGEAFGLLGPSGAGAGGFRGASRISESLWNRPGPAHGR